MIPLQVQDLALKILPMTTVLYLETRDNFFTFGFYFNRLVGSTKYMRILGFSFQWSQYHKVLFFAPGTCKVLLCAFIPNSCSENHSFLSALNLICCCYCCS